MLALQGVFQDLVKGPLVTALLWQKFLGHLASFVDIVPLLQAVDEASSASSSAVFHPLGRSSGQACSF